MQFMFEGCVWCYACMCVSVGVFLPGVSCTLKPVNKQNLQAVQSQQRVNNLTDIIKGKHVAFSFLSDSYFVIITQLNISATSDPSPPPPHPVSVSCLKFRDVEQL